MTTFQLLTLPVLGVLLVITAAAVARRRVALRPGAAWMLLWLASLLAIANPELLVVIAAFLGIGRGADLVFYLAILFGFVFAFLVYLRFKRLDEQITQLTRRIAILSAQDDDRP